MASLASRCFAGTIMQREDAADSGQSAMATTGEILLTAPVGIPRDLRGAEARTRRFVPSDVPPTQRSSVRSARLGVDAQPREQGVMGTTGLCEEPSAPSNRHQLSLC
jgi:hypothetical protein